MDDKNLLTDEKLDELLAALAEEEDEDFSPEFYEHEMERILKRKKELEAEAAGQQARQETECPVYAKKKRSLKPQWKAMLSMAAVFVFLICGTLLTRGSLRAATSIPGGQIVIVDTPEGAPGGSGLGIVDTSDVKNPEGFAGFMQDMWLFIKAALPYLCAAAVIAIIIVFVVRKMKSEQK